MIKFNWDESVLDFPPAKKIYPRDNRVYIFFNGRGLLFGLLLIFSLVIGLLYASNLNYLLTFFFGGIFGVSLVFTHFNLVGLDLISIKVMNAKAEDDLQVVVKVRNSSRRDKYHVYLEVNDLDLNLAQEVIPVIKAGEVIEKTLRFHQHKRGKYKFQNVKVWTYYPFGFLQSWKYFKGEWIYYVYPKSKATALASDFRLKNERQDGVNLKSGTDFSGFKKYEINDSIRRINWKSLSRGIPPTIKTFDDGGGIKIHQLKVPIKDHTNLNKFEEQLERLCWQLEYYLSQNDFVQIPGRNIIKGKGAEYTKLMMDLAEL